MPFRPHVITIAAAAGFAFLAATGAQAAPEEVAFPGPDGIELKAFLYRPAGTGPFPAVVALHGCSGLGDRGSRIGLRHVDWGERLAASGFLVLLPDSFGSRGLGPQCGVSGREVRPGRERVADAGAAKAYLQGRPDTKAGSVSLLGWSNGGSSVLYAAARGAAGIGPDRPDFARAVAFYPGCRLPLDRGWRDRVPLLILIGGADDWTDAASCEALVKAARDRREPVDVVVYPGAYHDFDHPNLPVRVRRNLAYTAGGTGTAHIGTDPAARADAIRRVPDFLAR